MILFTFICHCQCDASFKKTLKKHLTAEFLHVLHVSHVLEIFHGHRVFRRILKPEATHVFSFYQHHCCHHQWVKIRP